MITFGFGMLTGICVLTLVVAIASMIGRES
jgi:hypothetical protein